MKPYFLKRPKLTNEQTPLAFSARRRAIFIPILLVLASIVFDFVFDALTAFPDYYPYLRFALMFITGLLVVYVYRCPRCGDPPKSSQAGTSGVLLFPRKCSKCGAPLMPDHKWAQD